MDCEVEAEPEEQLSFIWWFNGSAANNEVNVQNLTKFSTGGAKSSLVFTPKTEADYGYYYCSASNKIGAQLEPCVFRVISIGM